jgi:hypothetical protein
MLFEGFAEGTISPIRDYKTAERLRLSSFRLFVVERALKGNTDE